MDQHRKKMIAPIVITVLSVVYYIAYFGLLMAMLTAVWKYVLGIVPIVLSVLLIRVCHERIKEIKGGEEDDLGKY